MTSGQIWVSGLADFDQIVRQKKPKRIISTISEHQIPPTPEGVEAEHHLVLNFNDISRPLKGMKAPDTPDMDKLIAFAQKWDEQCPIFVHCWMGISRSTASALIIALVRRPEFDDELAARHLRYIAPSATPNPRLIELADRQLGRGGALISAVNKIGRGRMASQGSAFCFDLAEV